MKRYILTGTPGSGKTSIIHALKFMGHSVIEEAATDIIALEQAQGISEPWIYPTFIDKIVNLQKQRQQQETIGTVKIQFFDRSPFCVLALAAYLKHQPSSVLLEEINRAKTGGIYQKKVFFVENLGFCTPTDARKISYTESLLFEKMHEEAYLSHGFQCIKITPDTPEDRATKIINYVTSL